MYRMNVCLIALAIVICSLQMPALARLPVSSEMSLQTLIEQGMASASRGDLITAKSTLERALKLDPNSVDANQLLGVVVYQMGDIEAAIKSLNRAIELDNYSNIAIVANFVEVLRGSGQLKLASETGTKALALIPPSRRKESGVLYYNLGVVEMHLKEQSKAIELLSKAVEYDPSLIKAWQLLAEETNRISPAAAEKILVKAVKHWPDDYLLNFMLGTAFQMQNKLSEALDVYFHAEKLNGSAYNVKGNIAAALQSMGKAEDALHYYELALPHVESDAGLFNNYGALLGIMGKHDEEVVWLTRALEADPYLGPAMINLAGHYQDEGLLNEARTLIQRAASPNTTYANTGRTAGVLFKMRDALMLSPVTQTWAQMLEERAQITEKVLALLSEGRSSPAPKKYAVDTTLDRIHFYISYHGLNDRYLQDIIMDLYRMYLKIEFLSPYILPVGQSAFPNWIPSSVPEQQYSQRKPRKARVGFISKFLGIFEPHGMLLDGVMKYLPREHFEVIALPVARGDGMPISPSVRLACDSVQEVSLTLEHAQAMVLELKLDILVFADTVSEPMNHFLAHSRLAPVQMAFWGNPITTGSQQIDYFISAQVMEHPYRTRMPIADEPYTEQVVLMEGQGIWYLRPDVEGDLERSNLKGRVAAAKNFTSADFGLEDEWFLYVLPQSTFKIHPMYDLVLRDILQRAPTAHLVVTGGRRERWTEIYLNRLRTAFGPELSQRLHMIGRVSSERFPALLKIADVILHPFPFDGSKTSADALEVHKPIVTLPTEYLRGRMGAAFLRTMNIPELVARNVSEYVDISVRLSADGEFYRQVVDKIADRVDLIWEDMEVPFGWSSLLCGIIGAEAPSWENFLALSGRDTAIEKLRTSTRNHNAALFDKHWGPESWLLHGNGLASLETMLQTPDQVPCIFLNWECSSLSPAQTVLKSNSDEGFSPLPASKEVTSSPSTSRAVLSMASRATETQEQVNAPAHTAETMAIEELREVRVKYLDLCYVGDFEKALPLALSLHPHLYNHPLYLTELGLIYIFQGDHSNGHVHCARAAELEQSASLIVGCLGLAQMYLPSYPAQETIDLFTHAFNVRKEEERRVAQTAAAHGIRVSDVNRDELEELAGVFTSPVFSINPEAIFSNQLTTCKMNGLNLQCVDRVIAANNLPDLYHGGAYILTFAAVNWSTEARPALDQLEVDLRRRDAFRGAPLATLWSEVQRLQNMAMDTLSIAIECFHATSSTGDEKLNALHHQALRDFMNVMDRRRDEAEAGYTIPPSSSAFPGTGIINTPGDEAQKQHSGLVLIQQFYAPNDGGKKYDINIVLWRNLLNDHISDIYLLNEAEVSFKGFPNNHKIHQIVIGERLTFKRAFTFANENLINRTVILANSDIFFDETLSRLSGTNGRAVPRLKDSNTVLALLKWVFNSEQESMTMAIRTDSQDAWVFQPPLSERSLRPLDFFMGLPRCDNRLVQVMKSNNYTVLNPAFAVRALEIDTATRVGHIYNTKNVVVGPVSNLLLSDKFVF